MEVYSRAIGGDGPKLTVISLDTGLPPTLNESYAAYPAGGRCRLVLTQKARDYKQFLALSVKELLNSTDWVVDTSAEYSVLIEQRLPRNSRDADANVKLVVDGVFQGLGVNDNRVFLIHLAKYVDRAFKPRLHIRVERH